MSIRVCERILRKGHVKAVEKAFSVWRLWTLRSGHQAALLQVETVLGDSKRAATLKMARKSINRMRFMATSSAIKTWKNNVSELVGSEARSLSLKKKVGTLFFSSSIRKCRVAFMQWRLLTKEHRITKRYCNDMQSIVQKHKKEVTFIFFDTHVQVFFISMCVFPCLQAAALKEALRVHQDKLQLRALGTLRSFASGSLTRSLARGFNTWRRLTAHMSTELVERSRREAVQTHVLRMMLNNAESEAPRLLTVAWLRWRKLLHHDKLRATNIHAKMIEIAAKWIKKREQDQRTVMRRWHAATIASRLSQGERRLRVRAALLVLVSVARRNLTRAWHTWSNIVFGNHVKKVLDRHMDSLKHACVIANMRFGDIVQVH